MAAGSGALRPTARCSVRLNREWLYEETDPARRRLGLVGALILVPMALLWFGARIPDHEPLDHRLEFLSLIGQAGFAFGLAGALQASRRSAVKWAGAISFAVGVFIVAAIVLFSITDLWAS
jgi:hypothetical protein